MCATPEEAEFLSWLKVNGATFPKVEWPTDETASGVRGAVALDDISLGESMVNIPERLIMSPPQAALLDDIGPAFREFATLLKNDNGLAIYIMREMLLKEKSFFWPYLRILPQPYTIEHWSAADQSELQDEGLVKRAHARVKQLGELYDKTIGLLSQSYADVFSPDIYTLDLYRFAWGTIRARAFGRRLPYSALVPFADCFNHGNTPTKYAFDGTTFTLWNSGGEGVNRGGEVLNSYGRRPNDSLLLEYGFSMLDNEWDEVIIRYSCDSDEAAETFRYLNAPLSGAVRLSRDGWPITLIRHCRICILTPEELQTLQETRRTSTPTLRNLLLPQNIPQNLPQEHSQTSKTQTNSTDKGISSTQSACNFTSVVSLSGLRPFPHAPYSLSSEAKALMYAAKCISCVLKSYPTSLENDEKDMKKLAVQGCRFTNIYTALVFRVTAKKLLRRQASLLVAAARFLSDLEAHGGTQDTQNHTILDTIIAYIMDVRIQEESNDDIHTHTHNIDAHDECEDKIPQAMLMYLTLLNDLVLKKDVSSNPAADQIGKKSIFDLEKVRLVANGLLSQPSID